MKLEQLLEGVSYTLVQGSLESLTSRTSSTTAARRPRAGFSSASWVPSGTATTTPPSAWPTA